MKIIKPIQRYARNRAIKKELERNGFKPDGEQPESRISYYWGTERDKMIPLDVFPTESIDISPIAYIGDRTRLQRQTKLSISQLEEVLTAQEPVQKAYGYASNYVFLIEVGSKPEQARQAIERLIRNYDYAMQAMSQKERE
jgi:hypothetical protein